MVHDHPQTFEERVSAIVYVLADMAKWPYDDSLSVKDFNSRMDYHQRMGRIPESLGRTHYGDDSVSYDTYGWQVFATTIPRLEQETGFDPDSVRRFAERERNKDNPVTATDGSKGQWEAARSARVRAAEWLVENYPE